MTIFSHIKLYFVTITFVNNNNKDSEVKFTASLWPVLHDLILGLERDSWNKRDTEDGDDGDDGDHDHNSATDTLKHIITIHHIYLLHTFKFTTPGMCLKCVRNDYHPMNTDQSYARSLSLNYPLYLVCLYVPHTHICPGTETGLSNYREKQCRRFVSANKYKLYL